MTKQPQTTTPQYGKAERKAEMQIDRFLAGINPISTASLVAQLNEAQPAIPLTRIDQ